MDNIEELYADLFAYRFLLLDIYGENEREIIIKLKIKLLDLEYRDSEINDILFNFYRFYNINIDYSELENISVYYYNIGLLNYNIDLDINNSNILRETSNISDVFNFLNTSVLTSNLNIPNEINNEIQDEYEEEISNINRNINIINPSIILNRINSLINNRLEELIENAEDVKITIEEDRIDKLEKNILENDTDVNCSICLEQLKKENEIIKLDCSHIYHSDCIKTYLLNYDYKCPLCRTDVGNHKYI